MSRVRQCDRVNHVDLHLDADFNTLFPEVCRDLTIEDAFHFNEIEEEEAATSGYKAQSDYEHLVTA